MLGPPRRGPAYKTKLCALWQRGHCSRDTCSFAHGNGELRRPPTSRSSFPHNDGRRDFGSSDFRGRIDRRFSPRRRHSPGRDSRGHRALHDRRPTSRERESSYSRSPSRKSERRHDKKTDDGETNSSRSLSVSDNKDDRKKDKFSSGDEKEDHEKQLKQIRLDIEVLREDKTHLEMGEQQQPTSQEVEQKCEQQSREHRSRGLRWAMSSRAEQATAEGMETTTCCGQRRRMRAGEGRRPAEAARVASQA